MTLQERLYKYRDIYIDSNGLTHWLWKGALSKGYGRINVNGINKRVIRITAELWLPDYKEYLQVCHKRICIFKKCFNPNCLYMGSNSDNQYDLVAMGRHFQANKKYCKHGHEFTSENTRLQKNKDGSVQRVCRKCRNNSNYLLRSYS